ncbi:MATE family efflux transporter [Mycoplasma zalophi]|uniref:Probable multidrug resistance protein NorM n=1 Tax=Mycoplasma zalophi TaxID=191287 RepID=A0ABS6DQG3_9MOLU|nr:MATE family efflux transporter [Mycoplasma zalophi]MBU4691271.1 MATE family efflux transporter [Mycoplasma zalophi]MBU4692523.1 MATE family efflux transporter [Mycoplasma zalophi]
MKALMSTKSFIVKHLPRSKKDWKTYLKITVPVIFTEIIFSLTAFLDNFMVTHIPNGVNALSYANFWTGILTMIFITINTIASMFVGQFYGSKQYSNLNQIMALRVWTYLSIALVFAIPALIIPNQFIQLVGPGDSVALESSSNYLKLMTIAWFGLAIAWNTNGLLSETGKSFYSMLTAITNITINFTINSILLFGFKMGAEAAAYGTIASVFTSIFLDSYWMIRKNKQIWLNPLNLFFITKKIAKLYISKIFAFIIALSAMIVIPLRMIIWNRAFPPGTVNEQYMRLSAASILTLTESIASVFGATIAACGANVAVFVATKLGENKFEEAERHALSLKGFHLVIGSFLSMLLIICGAIIYETNSLTTGVKKEVVSRLNTFNFEELRQMTNIVANTKQQLILQAAYNASLIQAKYLFLTILAIALTSPLQNWFYTTSAIISSGGRSTLSSITNFTCQWTHFIFLIILGLLIVPKYHISLPLTYFLFYTWDVMRLSIFEFVQHKFNWKVNITNDKAQI